jgi:hypothetical protein
MFSPKRNIPADSAALSPIIEQCYVDIALVNIFKMLLPCDSRPPPYLDRADEDEVGLFPQLMEPARG